MDDPFLTHWFQGFESALEQMDERNRSTLLAHCGRSCSDSYTRQIYVEAYQEAKDISDFLTRLMARFPESNFRLSEDGKTVELTYRYCACDLAAKGYLKTPLLCECSRQSLISNWESVLGAQAVTVERIQSILGGNDCCKFRIRKADPETGMWV